MTYNVRCVVPVNDIFKHDEFNEGCICKPRVEVVGYHKLIIHQAFDGREKFETEDLEQGIAEA